MDPQSGGSFKNDLGASGRVSRPELFVERLSLFIDDSIFLFIVCSELRCY